MILRKNNMTLFLVIILLIISLLFIIANEKFASGYEPSIFNSYPAYFWLIIIILNVVGIYLLVNQSFNNDINNLGLIGFSILIFVNFLIISLPLLRGYIFFGRGDVLTHYSFVKDIFLYGNVGAENFYPISHILVSIISLYSGISINNIIIFVTALFSIFYLIGIYLFAKIISKNRGEFYLILAFASVLIFSFYATMFIPTFLSFTFVPWILFFLIGTKRVDITNGLNKNFSFILVIFLVVLALFHPLTSILTIFIMLVFPISIYFYKIIIHSDKKQLKRFKGISNTILFLSVIVFTWISSFSIFKGSIKSIYNWAVYESGNTPVSTYSQKFILSDLGLNDLLRILFENYGHQLLYLLLSLFLMFFTINHYFKKIKIPFFAIFFILNLFLFLFVTLTFFFGALTIDNPERIFIYVLFFSTLFNGLMFHKLFIIKSKSKKIKYFIIIFLVICSGIGIYASFNSISIGNMNSQVTESEYKGFNSFIEVYDNSLIIFTINRELGRFYELKYGYEITKDSKYGVFKNAPYHFEFENDDAYIALTYYSKYRFEENWQDNPYYSKEDFNKLDFIYNKIYDDKGLQVWKIK